MLVHQAHTCPPKLHIPYVKYPAIPRQPTSVNVGLAQHTGPEYRPSPCHPGPTGPPSSPYRDVWVEVSAQHKYDTYYVYYKKPNNPILDEFSAFLRFLSPPLVQFYQKTHFWKLTLFWSQKPLKTRDLNSTPREGLGSNYYRCFRYLPLSIRSG